LLFSKTLILLLGCAAWALGADGQQSTGIQDHLQRAQQFLAQKQPQQAIQEYEAVLAVEPDNLAAQGNLGVTYYFAGQCEPAIGHLERALQLRADLPKIQALLGVCQNRTGRIEDAQKNLEAAMPLLQEPQITLLVEKNLADLYYTEGNLQGAGAMVENLLKQDPHNADYLYMMYRVHTDIADRARNAMAAVAPDSPRMHQMMAEHFINEGDADDAIAQYERALSADPTLPGARYELAEAVLTQSKTAESLAKATGLLQATLKDDPLNADAIAKLGSVAMIQNHRDQARGYFQQALKIKPEQFDALEGMADIAVGEEKNEEAAGYLERASRLDPTDDKLHYRLSRLYRTLNRKADADREMELFTKTRALKKKTDLLDQRMLDQQTGKTP
jgi:tetratricopeptide (TPR) repeat protein